MRENKIFIVTFVFTVLLSFISCKYDLIEAPSREGNVIKNPADYPDSILPPENLYATQGGYRTITLNWDKVENAVQYYIYSADSPFDTFTQIAETTSSETEIILEEKSGVSQYYAVSALNYYGTISSKSKIVLGSTLARPIITSIESSDSGDSVTVTWWMENCNSQTYENLIHYNIKSYDSKKEELSGDNSKATIAGSERSVTLTGFTPKTDYFFVVEAELIDEPENDRKSEKSDFTSSSTTHNVIPPAPLDFSVSQGISTDYIELKWNLPAGADYFDNMSNIYVMHPVYFEIQRAVYEEPSEDKTQSAPDFSVIKRIGVTGVTTDPNNKRLSSEPIDLIFDCETGTTYYNNSDLENASDILSISGSESEALEFYPSYKPGYTIIFKDNSSEILRGKKYLYKVISYTDDTSKKITSSEKDTIQSNTETLLGWKLSPAHFYSNKTYQLAEGSSSSIKSFTISFDASFDSFGIDTYKYIIKESFTPISGDVKETPISTLSSIEELKAFTKIIDCTNTSLLGIYKYSLDITDANDTILITQKSIGSITVVDNVANIPNIEYLEVIDGFNNKYELRWNFDASYTYSIVETLFKDNQDSTGIEQNPVAISTDKLIIENDVACFEYPAISGQIAQFEIIAEKTGAPKSYADSGESRFYTLGTPEITMSIPDYKSITVTWPPVQKSDSNYVVTAVYEDKQDNLINGSNTKITFDEKNNVYVCKIDKPTGYDDATISGLPITLSVTATNSETQNSTTGKTTVRTLGPAATKPTVSFTDPKNIIITWDKFEGASGYLVLRGAYNEGLGKTLEDKFDSYFISNSTFSTTTLNQELCFASTEYNFTKNQLTLTDSYEYYNLDVNNSYLIHQTRICLGIPYCYLVIPVMTQGDVTFDITDNIITAKTEDFEYLNISETVKKGSSMGYGLNVTASKSISNNEIEIQWEQPFMAENKSPKIYKRKVGDTTWKNVTTADKGSSAYLTVKETFNNFDTNAYEYAVFYEQQNCETAYTDYLASIMDEEISPKEQCNKGYLFAIPDGHLEASFKTGFVEKFSWADSTFDFSERKIGPDYYEIQVLNNNNTKGWLPVATILANGQYADSNESIKAESGVKIIDNSSTQTVLFEPIFNSDNISIGQFQVLRDYKHYYRLVAKKTVHKPTGTEIIEAVADKNSLSQTPFAYREITGEEFCKASILIITDGYYKIGKLDFENETHYGVSDEDKSGGTVYCFHNASFQIGKQYDITYTNYQPILITPTNKNLQFLAVNGKIVNQRNSPTSGSYPVTIQSEMLSISAVDKILPSSYSGTISFSISNSKNATIIFNDSTISIINDISLRRRWLPIKLYDDDNWYNNSIDYGWWN